MAFQSKKRKFQEDIFDEIDDHYLKKWRSVNEEEDDEEMLNIILPDVAACGITCNEKERKKNVDQISFANQVGGKMAMKTGSDDEFKNHLRLNPISPGLFLALYGWGGGQFGPRLDYV